MSLPSLPAQHLSDEAVAAFADDALAKGARTRAARHLEKCPECAYAVAVQREAVWALRAAPAPELPGGLLDRLRAVPSTTPLNQRSIALDDRGSAVFPAFGTAALVEPRPDKQATMESTSRERRHHHYGLITAAAAVVAIGAVTGTAASISGSGSRSPGVRGPVAPASVGSGSTVSTDLLMQPVAGTRGFAQARH